MQLVARLALVVLVAGACARPEPVPRAAELKTWPAPIVRADQVGALSAITILDAREAAPYAAGHLPGAARADWTITREAMLIGGLLDTPKKVAARFSALGVDDTRPVLVCGGARAGWGEEGRIAWTLRYLGHRGVALLDGGCSALKSRGWTERAPPARSGKFTPVVDKRLRARIDEVARAQPLDVRRREEFDGATPYFEARGGHIPNAKHLHFKALLNDEGQARTREEIKALLEKAGVDAAMPIVAYCTGGVRSAMATEILRARGFDVRNYDGSFWEWAASERPVE